LVIVVQFRWSVRASVDRGLGSAVKVLQFSLNGSQLLSEKVLVLLLGEGFVDDRGDLAADFEDGGEFDE